MLFPECMSIQTLLNVELGQLIIAKHSESFAKWNIKILIFIEIFLFNEGTIDVIGQSNHDLDESSTTVETATRLSLDCLTAEVSLG